MEYDELEDGVIEGIAAVLWYMAIMDAMEECEILSSGSIENQAPEPNDEITKFATELWNTLIRESGISNVVEAWNITNDDRSAGVNDDPERFGNLLGYLAAGAGPGAEIPNEATALMKMPSVEVHGQLTDCTDAWSFELDWTEMSTRIWA